MPSVFEREQIQQAWATTVGIADVERFRRLKEKFPRWTLRSLYATVNEFGREEMVASPADSRQGSF